MMQSSFVSSDQTRCGAVRCSLLIYILIVCCTQTLVAQEQSPATAPEPKASPTKSPREKQPATGNIKGRVMTDGGNAPANTVVNAVGVNSGTGATRTTRVDAKGRFVFDDLPVAVYTVMATAPGYIDEGVANGNLYELRRHLIGSEVTVRMIKGGVITGMVTNAKGEPIVGVTVGASLVGKRRDLPMSFAREGGNAETDDRGIYRLYGLPPGEYVVIAGGRGWFGRFVASGFENHAPTYYPSSTRDTAVPVTVRSGEEATGIDIGYRGLQGYSISGSVMQKLETPKGANVVIMRLWHVKSDSLVSIVTVNVGTPTRSFSFDGVADGEYDLSAIFFPDPISNGLSGSQRVTVKGSDVTDLAVSLTPLSSIEGVIKLEPKPAEEKCDKRGSHPTEILIQFKNESPNTRFRSVGLNYAGFTNMLDANSGFALRQLEPGKFRFDIGLPTEAWYLSEIKMPPPLPVKGSSRPSPPNVWQGIGTLKAGQTMTGVVIGVGQDAAGLRGRVSLPENQSTIPPGLQVHLVPEELEHADNVLRHYQTNVDSDGRFSVAHIAPGRYLLISRVAPASETTEPLTPAAWTPSIRAKLRRDAEALQKVVELKGCQRISDHLVAVQ